MVRNYKKKTQMPDNRAEKIEAAIKLITEQNYATEKAAKEASVPKETLRRWLYRRPMKSDSGSIKSVLNQQEEGDIVEALLVSSKHGWPCGTEQIQLMVKGYLNGLWKKTAFKDNIPGKDWLLAFKHRHTGQICQRKPEIVSKARAENLTAGTLNDFYTMVKGVYEQAGLFDDPDAKRCIFNTDETEYQSKSAQALLQEVC